MYIYEPLSRARAREKRSESCSRYCVCTVYIVPERARVSINTMEKNFIAEIDVAAVRASFLYRYLIPTYVHCII